MRKSFLLEGLIKNAFYKQFHGETYLQVKTGEQGEFPAIFFYYRAQTGTSARKQFGITHEPIRDFPKETEEARDSKMADEVQ